MHSADSVPLSELIEAALAIVGRNSHDTEQSVEGHVELEVSGGADILIRFDGPDTSPRVPREIADEELIRESGEWRGTYALVLRAPLVVLDVCWSEGEPLIIHTYSRGDWKQHLLSAAESQID